MRQAKDTQIWTHLNVKLRVHFLPSCSLVSDFYPSGKKYTMELHLHYITDE